MFSFDHLNYNVTSTDRFSCNKRKRRRTVHVLNNVNGAFPVGCLVGVMGPSGSGKTTLLTLLSQGVRVAAKSGSVNDTVAVTGAIRLAGQEVDSAFHETQCAYVPQHAALLPTITPREAIMFASRMRSAKLSTLEHKARTTRVLEQLRLAECADTRVGNALLRGLSGGEIKRTSVAVELVTNPRFLFLDEPTSGLDSTLALAAMQPLKQLTASSMPDGERRTVVAAIHQPTTNVFAMLDYLMLMKDGRVLYCGPRENVFQSLGVRCPKKTNPADFLLQLVSEHDEWPSVEPLDVDQPGAAAALPLEQEPVHEPVRLQSASQQHAPWLEQVYWLGHRAFATYRRMPEFLVVNVIQVVVLSLFIAAVFYRFQHDLISIQNRMGAIYFVLLAQTFASCLSIVMTFSEERAVFIREQATNTYSVTAYFIGKTAVDAPLTIINSIAFSAVTYYLVGFQPSAIKFRMFMLLVILVTFCGQAIGLIVAAAFADRGRGAMMTPLVIAPFILFTPLAVRADRIPNYMLPLKVFSPFWWSFHALVVNEFTDLSLGCTAAQMTPIPAIDPVTGHYVLQRYCFIQTGEQALQMYAIPFNSDIWWQSALMLLLISTLFRVIALCVLKLLSRKRSLSGA